MGARARAGEVVRAATCAGEQMSRPALCGGMQRAIAKSRGAGARGQKSNDGKVYDEVGRFGAGAHDGA